ncbi:MAG: hypothetical protein ACRYG8_46030 [Janthinobacterium lividum]
MHLQDSGRVDALCPQDFRAGSWDPLANHCDPDLDWRLAADRAPELARPRHKNDAASYLPSDEHVF